MPYGGLQALDAQRLRDPRRLLAARLMGNATEFQPVYSPLAAVAKALTGGVAGLQLDQADREDRTAREGFQKTLGEALTAGESGDINAMNRIMAQNPLTASDAMQQRYEQLQKANETPSGYTRSQTGGLTFIPGGPQDPATKAALAKAEAEATNPFMIARAQAGRPVTSVSVNTAENPFFKQMGEKGANVMYEDADKARKAADTIQGARAARQLIEQGIIAGTAADWRLAAARAFGTVGATDTETVARTEAFISQMGRQTLDLVKQLGSGTAISNADREYAEKVAGGSIAISPEGLKRILDINERASLAYLNRYQKTYAPLINDEKVPAYIRNQINIQAPEAAPPAESATPGGRQAPPPPVQAGPQGAPAFPQGIDRGGRPEPAPMPRRIIDPRSGRTAIWDGQRYIDERTRQPITPGP